MLYYLYKKMMENAVEEFRNYSEEQKERDIYLHKHKYLGWLIEKILTIYVKWITLILVAANVICFIVFSMQNSYQYKWAQIFSIALLLLTFIFAMAYIYIYMEFKADKQSAQDYISQTVSDIYLDNSKVVNWAKIKKIDKNLYQYLRSDECDKKAFTTTLGLANVLQDSKVKIVWMNVTQIGTGHQSGYAVLRKGKYVYDTNLKRTYKFKNYMKCRQAVIFKEFSLNEGKYFTTGSYKNTWQQFEMWCKEF